jgi:hypothetical protein
MTRDEGGAPGVRGEERIQIPSLVAPGTGAPTNVTGGGPRREEVEGREGVGLRFVVTFQAGVGLQPQVRVQALGQTLGASGVAAPAVLSGDLGDLGENLGGCRRCDERRGDGSEQGKPPAEPQRKRYREWLLPCTSVWQLRQLVNTAPLV